MKKLKLLLIMLFVITCSAVFGQQAVTTGQVTTTVTEEKAPPTSSKPRFDVGAGYWWTNARINYKLYASEPWWSGGVFLADRGDKVSELDNDLNAGLFVVNADAYLFWRLYVGGFVGWRDFDGEHTDSDWLPQYRSDLMQYSVSDAKGNVTTWDANAYLRLIEEKDNKGYLDISAGYFYYCDDIKHLQNSTITIANWTPVNIPIVGHDSQDKYTFDGLRLGARALIRPLDRIAVKLDCGIIPWLGVDNEKFWNLRDDYGNPPGLKINGTADGFAFDLTLGLEIKITKNLFIEGGYKYINLETDKGNLKWDWIARSGIEGTEDKWDVEGHRGGFYAMGRLKI